MADTFDMAVLVADLTLDEGVVLKPYKDSRGILSIGCGRNLQANGIRRSESDFMLSNDIEACAAELDAGFSWWRTLPPAQQRVMLNLCFNMGYATLATFCQFLGLMKAQDFAGAADDLEGTAWYTQVGVRGPRMIARLTGAVS